MALQRQSNHKVAVTSTESVNHLCGSCSFIECMSCPKFSDLKPARLKDYPQVIKGIETERGIIVIECDNYIKKSPKKRLINRPTYEFDYKAKTFVKVRK